MPYKYNKLRGRIIETYGSQRKFAERIGLSSNSVSKKLNGKTGFDQNDIVQWSVLLNIPEEKYIEFFFK